MTYVVPVDFHSSWAVGLCYFPLGVVEWRGWGKGDVNARKGGLSV